MKVRIELNIDDEILALLDSLATEFGVSRDECAEMVFREWLSANRQKIEAAKKVIA